MNDNIYIRQAEADEAGLIASLEQEIFSDPWTESTVAGGINGKREIYLAAYLGERLAGYAVVMTVLDEAELLRIGVCPSLRGRGIAARLMERLLEVAAAAGAESVFLEVREHNDAARSLYRKFGFHEVGVRKDYYRGPKEDGILMRADLLSQS